MDLYILPLQDLVLGTDEIDSMNYVTATTAHDIKPRDLKKRVSAMVGILHAPAQHQGHRAYTIMLAKKLIGICEHDGESELVVKIKNGIDDARHVDMPRTIR